MGQPSDGLPLQKKKMAFCSETTPGQKNMAHRALGDKPKICLPPLRIKLNLIKNL
jgi:hypothetical protein